MNTVGKIRLLAHLETGTESDKVYTKPAQFDEKRYADQKQLTEEEAASLHAVIPSLKELQNAGSIWYSEKTEVCHQSSPGESIPEQLTFCHDAAE